MKPCVVFCAAEFDRLLVPIPPDALVIAADGGLRHTDAIGVSPHVILGDFDSLGYVPQDARVFPVEKDDTDAMLAVRHGLAQGCDFFLFYGAMDGPRLDHTIANFQTLGFLSEHGATGVLVGRDYLATVISGQSVTFPAAAQGVISLFCLGSDAAGVTLEGLQYPLTQGTLHAGFPLGVSNHFIGAPARIRVEEGLVLALWDRRNGLCRWE